MEKNKKQIYAIIAGILCGIEGIIDFYFMSIFGICGIGMSLTLFLKKGKGVIIFSGVGAICSLIMSNFYQFFFYTSIVLLFFLALKKKNVVKKIWFIPAIVVFLRALIMNLLFVALLNISIAVLLGMCSKEYDDIFVKSESSSNYSKVDNSISIHTNIGEADMIKTYKELLEKGIITPEEFEKKKKKFFE